MDPNKRKKTVELKREKVKKNNSTEKKTKSETITFSSGSSLTGPSLDNIFVVGKSCGFEKLKVQESGYRLHECFSAAAINPLQDSSQNLRSVIHSSDGLQPVASNSSFLSAKSDVNDVFQKQIFDLEDRLVKQNVIIHCLKMQLGDKQATEFISVATETDTNIADIEEHNSKEKRQDIEYQTLNALLSQLKDLEKKISNRDKKIKELLHKLEEYKRENQVRLEESSSLNHRVSLQNRQLQSMFELLGEKKWNSIDPTEFAKYKNKATELESTVAVLETEKSHLSKKLKALSTDLENKDKELTARARELIEYKNRSTLEMCKLINQVDCLQKEAKEQSEILDSKIIEAQTCMEDEIVNITHKLEEQYQKDMDSAVEKFHADFERLANLPRNTIDQLLKFCESDKVDFLAYQKEWDRQQAMLEEKVASIEEDRNREVLQLKENYESKVVFLKAQVEALTSQLKERKDIIDIFENELMVYKSNSSINLLKASTLGDDISSLKELYNAEIFSQKQVHKLQMDVFEGKVKTLTEEILYHAKNEEIQLQELERAKQMAVAFREKYEHLVHEWEEKVEKDFKATSTEPELVPELDIVITELKSLMNSLRKSEEVHEERIQMLEARNNDEKLSFLKDIEEFKRKLQELVKFQKTQAKLDETIHALIKNVGINYTKAVESLLMSHVTEVSLKQMEMCASEKRHIEEIDELKNDHEKEVEDLRIRAESLEDAKILVENELATLRKTGGSMEVEAWKKKTEEMSMECIKSEGIIAIKEETENALGKRIKELEEMIEKKEENCRKELEDLMAKYMKAEILSSSKDDLAKELEDKLTQSESLLAKSCREVDRLTEICARIEEKRETTHAGDGGDQKVPAELGNKIREAKEIGERLKTKLLETFEKQEKNNATEEEKTELRKENEKLRAQIASLWEEIKKKEKILEEMKLQKKELLRMSELKINLELLEAEKNEILERENQTRKEKEDIQERNEILEDKVKYLNERVDLLMLELANTRDSEERHVFSISLQQFRFHYEEEQGVEPSAVVSQLKALEENEAPELKQRSIDYDFQADVISKLGRELSDVVKERDELMVISERLGKERDRLKEELNMLLEENNVLRSKCAGGIADERGTCSDDSGVPEMNEEIGKLTEYIKSLSKKLETMKANNELLLSESQEHLKHNQNLVSELEEAWNERYEIEDQLTKVRRENALLNLHRRQLEETNKRISGLVAEGKPSVVSWIKIHETVENIVDEVLALKTSFSDSGSGSGASTGFDLSRTNSDLKLMTETLHAQLKNKTFLCDELIVQKETLEKELKNLERLLLKHDTRMKQHRTGGETNISGGRRRRFEMQTRQPAHMLFERRHPGDLEDAPKTSDSANLITLNRLKKHLEDQVELEQAQFRENLELEIQELKREIGKLESPIKCLESKNDECLKSIETRHEEEVVELTREFEREVERLKEAFGSEESGENYEKEIEKLKTYFEGKWSDLEKRYIEIYKTKRAKSESELGQIVEYVSQVLAVDEKETEKKTKLENCLAGVISRRDEEVESLRERYMEAVALLESKHGSEVQKLQTVVLQLRENIMTALKRESGEPGREVEDGLVERIRAEYEEKLEEEKKKLCDLLEDTRQKHEKEILALEEFWTEKLSECETKCAIMKATGGRKPRGEIEERIQTAEKQKNTSQEEKTGGEDTEIANYNEEFDSGNYMTQRNPEESLCVSCLANGSVFKRMEVKTDDDKLDVIQQRDTLEEMVTSMRNIVTKLLTFIGQNRGDVSNMSFDDTMYRSIHMDLDRTVSDASMVSTGFATLAKDLSTIFQEIRENSLLNSSDQVRFELDRCLNQLKIDATSLLALSCPADNSKLNLAELVRKVEKEKNDLEAKVLKVEEAQKEMKKEITTTKERLSQWERNLEVVSEGYGEEIVEPKQIISLADMKEKLKAFLTETCGHSPQDINLLEEICKEGDRLQEEWMKEKCDLQQQIDAADKQLHSLKKFLEEQAVEREQEREAFDREINQLQESLRARERDSSAQNRTNREVGRLSIMPMADDSVEALVTQVKELTTRLTETEKNKEAVEGEFQNAVKKIWSLREVIQELELQLAEVCERENNLKKKVEKLESVVEQQSKSERNLKEELETCRSQSELKYSKQIKSLEDELLRLRHVADQVNPESLTQLKASLREIEGILIKKTRDLEQLHVSSANVSCSSPSEDVSIRDHLDATRCSTPDEMSRNEQPLSMVLPMEEIDRVQEKLARHTRAEEVAMKHIQDLKMQLRNHRKAFEEVQTERDVLLDKVDVYLKENSSLKVRLEEQRCNAGLLQKQLNANLESQINRLEVDVEKLNEMCNDKDKQLRDMKVILENTTKSLKVRETEALNKSKEENSLITTLRTDLANALNQNEKLEEKLERTREKLRESLKMPALIDSMIDEKNAEIDRLEKEVARLACEKTRSEDRHKRKIRFSEPESFSGNISSISAQYLSDMRNCSDSCADFRNSSFKTRRPVGSSTKLESISSIAPLQLSPRGADSFSWRTSSPIFPNQPLRETSPSKSSPDLEHMEEMSKLQEEVETKRGEISELHLEIDILKRKLVELGQEVTTAKCQTKEIQNELTAKEEEIRKLKAKETEILATMESLKKNHAEEVEELENKLRFEHGKVETVYEEIKALEVKKIEIEEAFLSLKEDYNEKINGEKKTAEALMTRIKALEVRNGELELKMAAVRKESENAMRSSENTIQELQEQILDLKSLSSQKTNASTQVESDACVCGGGLTLEMPETDVPLKENLNELKTEFEKMAAVIGERDFNKKDAFAYAVTVRQLLTVVLDRVEELTKEVEAHMKKVMECSVDDLAVRVQKELVLSAKLDNQLLSSIEANGFVSKETTPQPELGGGDGPMEIPKPLENAALVKVTGLYKSATAKMTDLTREREELEEKVSKQQKIIRLLEESLRKEKERILEEKERCTEDAKIMELLRVNLEKRLTEVKAKERELRKEKQQRMALEKEVETWKKQAGDGWEGKKIAELNAQLESQKEKIVSMGKLLEEEKKKSQELRLALEEERIEKISEKNAHRMVESDLSLVREQKESLKIELFNARELLHSRSVEIGLLKRKINLQEIDIKALSVSNNQGNPGTPSRSSNAADLADMDSPTTLLLKMNKLNSCVQRHVRESSEMGEALLYLSHETEQMRDIIRKLEDGEGKLADETLVADVEVERKLWALEKGKLVMDLESLKRENGVLKRDLFETSKNNEVLKLENGKLRKATVAKSPKKEGVTNLVENGFLQERVAHLTRKYMRAESYRKALAWQKHYLQVALHEYQRSEEEAWRKIGRRRKEKRKEQKPSGRFRVVALAVLSIFRMKFIVRKWQRNLHSQVFSLLDVETTKLKLAPLASVLNIYNEPVNPLSYQTQNIFRQSSSQVLRTPPSRDPGPQSFFPDRLESMECRRNVPTLKGLP